MRIWYIPPCTAVGGYTAPHTNEREARSLRATPQAKTTHVAATMHHHDWPSDLASAGVVLEGLVTLHPPYVRLYFHSSTPESVSVAAPSLRSFIAAL